MTLRWCLDQGFTRAQLERYVSALVATAVPDPEREIRERNWTVTMQPIDDDEIGPAYLVTLNDDPATAAVSRRQIDALRAAVYLLQQEGASDGRPYDVAPGHPGGRPVGERAVPVSDQPDCG